MILTFWLDQPVWLMFGLLALLFFGASALLWLATQARATRPFVLRLGTGIVPTYFGAVSVLLSLLTGFVANDAWERQRSAARAVQGEGAHALAIHDLSRATASDMSEIRAALKTYLEAVIDEEWPQMALGEGASSRVGRALGELMRAVAEPRHGLDAGAAAHQVLMEAVMSLRAARGERLALADSHGDETKWAMLLALAGLTLIAIGLVHLDRPVSQAVTLGIFALAMVTTLGVVGMHERPFDGPLAVRPEPLRLAQAAMETPPP